MEDTRSTIAQNITQLRLRNNLTQMELAEKLNYSDKTVSKWERAESSPDISVLVEIADLFGVTLDALVRTEDIGQADKAAKAEKAGFNRKAVAYLSESVVWIASLLAFIITTLILKKVTFQWLYFVYALPIALIVKLVFNTIWFKPRQNYLIVSILMWALLAATHMTFLYFSVNAALVYLLGIVGQIVVILWSFVNRPKAK